MIILAGLALMTAASVGLTLLIVYVVHRSK